MNLHKCGNMKVLAFGIAKDIFSSSIVDVHLIPGSTISDLKIELEGKFPQLSNLGSYMFALNNEYASIDAMIHEGDEIAVIPPVSGG